MDSAESLAVTVSCLRATEGCKELLFVLVCDASVGICQMTEEGVMCGDRGDAGIS